VCAVTKPSQERWNSCLGHPSLPILQRVLGHNKLPVSKESCDSVVCDVCQQRKAHQLSYPKSSSVSNFPLELVFSYVWGHATESVGSKKYYVSFIDDFSKYVWIYTLKTNLRCLSIFMSFKISLNDYLTQRSLPCKQTRMVSTKD
jgi:hypothetical protein